MKKKIFSGFLAAAMVLSMSVSAFAANEVTDFAGTTDVGGSGTVLAVSDVVDVIVPTNVNYAVNPAELSDKPQIMSGSFGVINHGSTAVKVDVTATIADSTTVTISDADTIAAINNATDAADVSEDALLYLAVAPVKAGLADDKVKAETVTGAAAYSKVDFDVVADVAEDAAVAIPSGSPASMAFKLDAAAYTAEIAGEAVTTGGGFDTTGVEAVQEYAGDYKNDPVAAFTLIGSANKYADWTAVTLPEVTLSFSFSKLNTLAYDALEVDPATENMVAAGEASEIPIGVGDNVNREYAYNLGDCVIPVKGNVTDVWFDWDGENYAVNDAWGAGTALTPYVTFGANTVTIDQSWFGNAPGTYTVCLVYDNDDSKSCIINLTVVEGVAEPGVAVGDNVSREYLLSSGDCVIPFEGNVTDVWFEWGTDSYAINNAWGAGTDLAPYVTIAGGKVTIKQNWFGGTPGTYTVCFVYDNDDSKSCIINLTAK